METRKKLIIAGSIIGASVVIALGVNAFVYKGKPYDYVQTEKNLKKQKAKKMDQFNELKSDSFPTAQEVVKYVKDETGKDPSGLDLNKLTEVLSKKYGKEKADSLIGGYMLNENMTPDQIKQAEIKIAQMDSKREDYVGMPKTNVTSNIYDLNEIQSSGNTFSKYSSFAYATHNKGHMTWTKQNGYRISSPVLLGVSSNTLSGEEIDGDKLKDGYTSVIVFVELPDKEVQKDKFLKFISTIDVTVNGHKEGLSGTKVKSSQPNGMALADSEWYSGKVKFKDADEIFPNSIIPVVFDVPTEDIKGDRDYASVKVNDSDEYRLKMSNPDGIYMK